MTVLVEHPTGKAVTCTSNPGWRTACRTRWTSSRRSQSRSPERRSRSIQWRSPALAGLFRSRPVSRILSRVTISRLERRTRLLGGPRRRSLLRLAPDGVWQAGRVTTAAGGLLPHRFTLTGSVIAPAGGLLSVPLSVGFRRLGVPPSVLPCGVRTFLERSPGRAAARGHPACTTDGNAISAISLLGSATIDLHSGHASAPRTCRTNSPQTRHSRLTPRMSAASSWSSVAASGATAHRGS